MKQLIYPILALLAFGGGYLLGEQNGIKKGLAECCNPTSANTCNLDAPSNFNGEFDGSNNLNLTWNAVQDASHYLVDVYRVTPDSVIPVSMSNKTPSTDITIADAAFLAGGQFQSVVTAVCDDCTPSVNAAFRSDCAIIIVDDIVKYNFSEECRSSLCSGNESSISVTPTASTWDFAIPNGDFFYRVDLTCGNDFHQFIFIADNYASGIKILLTPCAGLSCLNDCLNLSGNGCGYMVHYGDPYFEFSVDASGNASIYNLDTKCSLVEVWQYPDCNISYDFDTGGGGSGSGNNI